MVPTQTTNGARYLTKRCIILFKIYMLPKGLRVIRWQTSVQLEKKGEDMAVQPSVYNILFGWNFFLLFFFFQFF